MAKFALLGEKLGHSFSPQIHGMLADYEYGLREVEKENLKDFLENCGLDGMNVTIPYKKNVLPYCAYLSDAVKRIGSANTLVKRDDGWHAYNTDYFGFRYMVESCGYSPAGKKAVVMGAGGASLAVCTALEDMGAAEIVVISRKGENNYNNLHLHADAEMLVNATPVGMYPHTGEAAASLDSFPNLKAVFDIVYNPSRTELMLQAEKKGLIHRSGLSMLVAQAHKAAEYFLDREIPKSRIEEILSVLEAQLENIVLIGMPGCGKSSIGRALAELTGRKFVDADEYLMEKYGMFAGDMIVEKGEEFFRGAETEVLSELGKQSSLIIATGGGCVTRARNYPQLHQNGRIFWIKRNLEELPTEGRPLSQRNSLSELYEKRKTLYESFADAIIENDGSIDSAAAKILGAMG